MCTCQLGLICSLWFSLSSYLGPPCRTIVTGPTKWVTPPTLTAAVSSSLIWTSACFRVLPRLQRVCAADRKLLLDTYQNRFKIFQCQTRIHLLILMHHCKKTKKQQNLQNAGEWVTYSLIRCSPNKGEELSQQHTVRWFVTTVLYGQRLEQGKWAATMTCRVVSPPKG